MSSSPRASSCAARNTGAPARRPRDIFDPSGPETPSPVAARRVEDAKRHGDLLRKVMMHTTATDETVAHQLDAL